MAYWVFLDGAGHLWDVSPTRERSFQYLPQVAKQVAQNLDANDWIYPELPRLAARVERRWFRPGVKRSLDGRVAMVTGASSGIGLATAKALARAGARLVLVSRSEARLQTSAREVARVGGGGSSLLLPCDVSDPEAVVAMADRVRRDVGAPDILVNNAGIGHWAPVVELSLDRIRSVFDVNFFGAVHCTKAFLPAMLQRRQGTVVFVSSGLGALSFPYSAAYCASKHALNGFAGSLRAEVEPLGVKVLLVLPGGTRTAFFDANAYPADVLSRYLFQRLAEPDRVARRIVQAVIGGRRRVVMGRLNDLGLRLAGALPELEGAFLSLVGRRILKRESSSAEAPRSGG
jgi:short-subunit dehydrogenase